MKRAFGAFAPGFILLIVGSLTGCMTNPATGQRELSLIGEGQEIQMGREADPQIVASMGLYDDPDVQRYVSEIGQRLAALSERPELPWTFRVIDDPTVNAFALPGGFIYVTRGILAHMNSEAELAGVLGHEIGHVTARHSASQASRAQLAQLGLGIGMILAPELATFGELAGAGLQLLFLRFGRDDEHQADELGVRYVRRANYDPTELAEVMRMLDRTSQAQEGSGRVPGWLSTHPDPGDRVASILEEVRRTEPTTAPSEPLVVRRDDFMRRLDGMVFGANPREGYFEGSTFLHPDLRFRFDFPSGWEAVNQKQAVQAASPNRDAVIAITLAEGSPAEALRTFASGQDIRVGGPVSESVNGLSAVKAEFVAATEQGTLRGLVVFVTHVGSTYRLLGYAPQGRWGGHASGVSRSLGSFAPLDDPAALSVQPMRVDVVEAPATMTLAAFLERYPSNAIPETVALINHLEGDGPIEAGALYKRVIGGR